MKYCYALILVLLVFLPIAGAQISTISSDLIGHAGGVGGQNVVRDSQGKLYALRIDGSPGGLSTLKIAESTNSGLSWTDVVTSGINGPTTGETNIPFVIAASIAIDDRDVLHITWACNDYPNTFQPYYRSVDPQNSTMSAVLDIKASLGIAPFVRTAACNVVVDINNRIWITAPTSGSWKTQLLRSDAPYAAGNLFTSVGGIGTINASQIARLAVDLAGRIHCTYYAASNTGDYRHHSYDDSNGTWSAVTDIGNLSPTNDYTGGIACDYLGNTHIVSMRDTYGTGNPQTVYYRLDSQGNFFGPITIMSATNSQFSGIGNFHTLDIACDEVSGDVFVLMRDFANGADLRVHYLPLGASAFSPYALIAPASTNTNEYHSPRIRGSLFPEFNNMNGRIDCTWRQNSQSPFDFNFTSIPDPNQPAYPGNGSDAAIRVSINGTTSSPSINIHNVGGGDFVILDFLSPGGTLTGQPLLCLGQILASGVLPTPTTLLGDPLPSFYIDLNQTHFTLVLEQARIGEV